jgi:hypothetical protein
MLKSIPEIGWELGRSSSLSRGFPAALAYGAIPGQSEKARAKDENEDERRPHYSPISPSPGILGRLSVDSSGGSRKPAHEQSKSDETTRKIAAAHTVVALMQ